MLLYINWLIEGGAIFYIKAILAFLGSICIHAFSHAIVARWLGTDTAAKGGSRSLNPFKVMGWWSIVCLLLFGFSWGTAPVMPDEPNRMHRSAVALAGPLSHFFLLLLAELLLLMPLPAFVMQLPEVGILQRFFMDLAYANAFLFLFNILPLPGLDGWQAVEPFLPRTLVPKLDPTGLWFHVFSLLAIIFGFFGFFEGGMLLFWAKCTPRPSSPAAAGALESTMRRVMARWCFMSAGFEDDNDMGPIQAFYRGWQANPSARGYLAKLLLEGEVCEKDEKRAFSLLNDPEVYVSEPEFRSLLGRCHYAGLGTEEDFKKAAGHLRAAADAGDADAMDFLGYENGRMPDYGMPLEEFLRQRWQSHFSVTSDRGVQEIPERRGYLGILLAAGAGAERDAVKAFQLLDDKEVLQVMPLARGWLALLLLEGEVCDKDEKRAFSLLDDKEVLQAMPLARGWLSLLLLEGEVCDKDEKRAFSLLDDSEVYVSKPAFRTLLGGCHYAGLGTEQDFKKAAEHLRAAADAGDPDAMDVLGYENGRMPDYGMPLEEFLRQRWLSNQ